VKNGKKLFLNLSIISSKAVGVPCGKSWYGLMMCCEKASPCKAHEKDVWVKVIKW